MAARSIKDVIEGGRLKRFIDPRLIKALSHPLREHVLAVFNERVASTSEIGREIDLEVPAFYHHVEVLEDLGCIERVESRRRRGAKEHFFRAKSALLIDDSDWLKIPASIRSDLMVSHIQSLLNDFVRALSCGAFAANVGTHVTWLPGVFDRLGWQECMVLMNETLTRMMEIQKCSRERIAVTGEAGIPATIALLGFETSSSAGPSPGDR
jgi:DNA-binding transcriptional ArsR family regulator